MADEKKEAWLNYLAVISIVLALSATFSTYRGGGYSSKTMMSQIQASDQWSFYQAKSIKSNLYEVQKQELQRQIKLLPPKGADALRQSLLNEIQEDEKRIARYDSEKVEIEKKARTLEAVRDESIKHGSIFGVAVIFFQVAILLSSIASLMKKKMVWIFGTVTGLIGLVYFLNGFWLWF